MSLTHKLASRVGWAWFHCRYIVRRNHEVESLNFDRVALLALGYIPRQSILAFNNIKQKFSDKSTATKMHIYCEVVTHIIAHLGSRSNLTHRV